jgi:hypothetical protein
LNGDEHLPLNGRDDDARAELAAGLARLRAADTAAFRLARTDSMLGSRTCFGAGVTRLSTRHTLFAWVLATDADAREQFAKLASAQPGSFESFRATPVYNPIVWFFAGGTGWTWSAGRDQTKINVARAWPDKNPVSVLDRLASARDVRGVEEPDGGLRVTAVNVAPRTRLERLARRRPAAREVGARLSDGGDLQRASIEQGSQYWEVVIDEVGLDLHLPPAPDDALARRLLALADVGDEARGDWMGIERRLVELVANVAEAAERGGHEHEQRELRDD